MEDFEVTKREVLVVIIITLLLITLGFFISTSIENEINESNEKYFKALKIDNNVEQFKYAIKTNIGYVLAQGKIKAVDPIVIEDIEGQYFYIKKVKEKYTMHTRQVAHTRTKSNGTTETYYTTEIYYTWDYAGEEEFHIKKFEYLENEFEYGTINFSNDEYKETIKVSSDTRYKYYIIPSEFEGSLFTNIVNNTITENEFYYNTSITGIIEQKESDGYVIGFWVLWTIFIIGVSFAYVSFENHYLEDN